ncbi:helix-turn-helix DNA binding domain protein [Gordonia Phage Zitch]|uniref:Helix-turn-helix DNA binding domain protein n=1 Tax=Gordonia Phage Zitch TaxID=2743909 RepID=A0A7G3V9U7_9CAUD|nr:helix-turn-helix DNA binding domain protein [Gordonia Phage Zitch]QKY78503.1 helix-turn-helix DNA binding domain protein [Gordonia Phage Zitch]
MTSPEPANLSIPDTAVFLGGVHRSYVYRLIESGELTRIHIGRRAMVTRASIDAYLERQAETDTVNPT